MKVYCEIDGLSTHALRRIRGQIHKTAPRSISFVNEIGDADIAIRQVFDSESASVWVKQIPTVIVQLCYLTAGSETFEWESVWGQSLMVSSYYDLPVHSAPFVRHPLGIDPVFRRMGRTDRHFDAVVTGYVDGDNAEEIKSVYNAFHGDIMHVGPNMRLGRRYHNVNNVSDLDMAILYNNAKFTIGLRHVEGFELPIIEGAACGAVPITFDLECYRHWFDDFAIFIDPKGNIENQLRSIADTPYKEVSKGFAPNLEKFKVENAWKPFWDKFAEATGG